MGYVVGGKWNWMMMLEGRENERWKNRFCEEKV